MFEQAPVGFSAAPNIYIERTAGTSEGNLVIAFTAAEADANGVVSAVWSVA